MIYHFNVSGIDRKNLVNAISGFLSMEAKYLGQCQQLNRL